MARYGAKSPLFAPFSGAEPSSAAPVYATGFTIGKLVNCGVTPNYAEANLDADNITSEYVKLLTDEDISLETDTLLLMGAVKLYGAQIRGSDIAYTQGDIPPIGGFAFYHSELRDGVVYHIGHFFPKVRASRTAQTFATRGKQITLGTTTISLKANYTNLGDIEEESEPFATEEAAFGWCASKVGIGNYYVVDVTVQGATSNKYVDKAGKLFLPSGEAFALTITGTATALYDNGTDKISSVSSGVYTIANITANHTVTVIF